MTETSQVRDTAGEGRSGDGQPATARVGVVGGGITGLATLHYLRDAGVDAVLFESAPDPGGAMRSSRIDGRVVEHGPQRTRVSPGFSDLVAELDLEAELREAADLPLYVYHHGKLRRVPQSVSEAVATDLLSWRGKLRVLLEPLTGGPRPGETVADFLTRTFGAEVADYYLGPLYGGLYGSRPEEMYVEYSLGRALEKIGVERSVLLPVLRAVATGVDRPPVVTFADGMQTLPRRLAARHGETVALETPVTGVRAADDGYVVETLRGETRVADVVLTTPADVTAGFLEATAPGAASRLGRLNYNPMVLAYLEADCDRRAAGYQVQFDEDYRTLGVTFNDHLLDRDGVYTVFLGGAKTPGLVEWADERVLETAAREFEDVTGCPATPLGLERLPRGMPAYDTSWTALDGLTLPAGLHLATNYTTRAGIPGRLRQARSVASRLATAR